MYHIINSTRHTYTSRWITCHSNVQLKDSAKYFTHTLAHVWRFQRHVSHGEFRRWRHWPSRDYLTGSRMPQVRPPPIRSSPFNRQGVPSTCVKLHLGCKSFIEYRSKAIICLFSILIHLLIIHLYIFTYM